MWRQAALLDYLQDSPKGVSLELLETGLKYGVALNRARRGLLSATDEAQQKAIRQEVHQLSGDLLLEALDTAAQATSRLLGPKTDDYGFRANLMLPVNWEVLDSPFFMDDSTGRRNKERADHLWQHTNQQLSEVLVVVAEAGGRNSYFGFWVPVYSDSVILPGSPTAYQEDEGSAVFKDDLPPFSEEIPRRQIEAWRYYMRSDFEEDLFVSLPFRLNSSKKVSAIFNINVRMKKDKQKGEQDGWRRAYHRVWLRKTRDQIKSSLCQAFEAFILKCDTLEGTPFPRD